MVPVAVEHLQGTPSPHRCSQTAPRIRSHCKPGLTKEMAEERCVSTIPRRRGQQQHRPSMVVEYLPAVVTSEVRPSMDVPWHSSESRRDPSPMLNCRSQAGPSFLCDRSPSFQGWSVPLLPLSQSGPRPMRWPEAQKFPGQAGWPEAIPTPTPEVLPTPNFLSSCAHRHELNAAHCPMEATDAESVLGFVLTPVGDSGHASPFPPRRMPLAARLQGGPGHGGCAASFRG